RWGGSCGRLKDRSNASDQARPSDGAATAGTIAAASPNEKCVLLGAVDTDAPTPWPIWRQQSSGVRMPAQSRDWTQQSIAFMAAYAATQSAEPTTIVIPSSKAERKVVTGQP